MKEVFGVVFSNMHDHNIKELTAGRCMGSLPVGGRYRLIDFVLSGFSHAGIVDSAVITKSNYKSLLDHIGNGREWDLARKRGGLMVLPPAALSDSGNLYNGRIEALKGIMGILRDSPAKYVVIADCDAMANIDYADFVNFHIQNRAEITVMNKRQYFEGKPTRDLTTFDMDEKGNVVRMYINPEIRGEQFEYLNIMLINKDMLEWIIRECVSRGLESFERDVLQANVGKLVFKAYEFTGFACRFDSVKAYYESNLALLDPKARASLFPENRPIYTNVWDEAPVRYGLNARVENSLLADGCVIEGQVENCLLSRGVYVARGAKVRNSVLMQGTHVGSHVALEHIITDKRVMIKDNRTLIGQASYPMYIAKSSVV